MRLAWWPHIRGSGWPWVSGGSSHPAVHRMQRGAMQGAASDVPGAAQSEREPPPPRPFGNELCMAFWQSPLARAAHSSLLGPGLPGLPPSLSLLQGPHQLPWWCKGPLPISQAREPRPGWLRVVTCRVTLAVAVPAWLPPAFPHVPDANKAARTQQKLEHRGCPRCVGGAQW